MPNIVEEALGNNEILLFPALRGVLEIKGLEAKDFLQRMSTNDLTKISDSSLVQTSFINNKGRIIDHAYILARDEESFLIISSHDHGKLLFDWLEQFHFVEDFHLQDLSHSLSGYFLITKSTNTLKNHHKIWQATINELDIDIYLSLEPIKDAKIIDQNMFEIIRIAALMPGINEINETNMPQNINLTGYIAVNKGCYIGQEVIAKAITYQKRVKTLCGAFISKTDLPQVQKGMPIMSSSQEIGIVSSIAPYYVDGLANILVISDLSLSATNPPKKDMIISNQPFIRRNPNNLQ